MCVCIYMCVYMCVYLYICVCVYLCVCIYIYIYIRVCVCICVYIYIYIYIYVCVYIYIYISVCVYICVCIYIYKGHSMNNGIFSSKIIFFQNFFYHKGKHCIYKPRNWLRAKIILISQTYLFWCYSKWQQIKENAPGLNKGLSSNFCWLWNTNHVKSIKECVLCMKKHVLVKKCL